MLAERVLLMCDGKIVSELRFSKIGENMDERIERVMKEMQKVDV